MTRRSTCAVVYKNKNEDLFNSFTEKYKNNISNDQQHISAQWRSHGALDNRCLTINEQDMLNLCSRSLLAKHFTCAIETGHYDSDSGKTFTGGWFCHRTKRLKYNTGKWPLVLRFMDSGVIFNIQHHHALSIHLYNQAIATDVHSGSPRNLSLSNMSTTTIPDVIPEDNSSGSLPSNGGTGTPPDFGDNDLWLP